MALIGYALLEIVVDNVLVFTDLTGGRLPSLTAVLLGWAGIDLGSGADLPASLSAVAPAFGVAGAICIAVSIWLLVRR